MPWISLIGMFTHVLLPQLLIQGRVCLNFCLAGLMHLTPRHLNCCKLLYSFSCSVDFLDYNPSVISNSETYFHLLNS